MLSSRAYHTFNLKNILTGVQPEQVRGGCFSEDECIGSDKVSIKADLK